jgi:hypothetical protein
MNYANETSGTISGQNFIKEYKEFIETYLLRFLGIGDDHVSNVNEDEKGYPGEKGSLIIKYNSTIYIRSSNKTLFKIEKNYDIDDESIILTNKILKLFIKFSRYSENNDHKKTKFLSSNHQKKNMEFIIQKGICEWISNRHDSKKIESLLDILEAWSSKTYEGKKVSFGIVINPKSNSDDKKIPFLPFLEDEYSAVISDGISSIIELDVQCNFLGYHSIYENGCIMTSNLDNNIPLRFVNSIMNFVVDDKIGVFLLNNGDIMIAKNRIIEFVKRNGTWLNFNVATFENSLQSYISRYALSKKLVNEVYSSALDVSFSHGGGIIAVTHNIDILIESKILSDIDYLDKSVDDDFIDLVIYKKTNDNEKRQLKRKILLKLVKGKNFCDIDRKLRSELVSMDGATIIDATGRILTFGAIIQNDSGSSGGGRGAAAKKLSNYGFSIKISTDGYIEVFEESKRRHVIK